MVAQIPKYFLFESRAWQLSLGFCLWKNNKICYCFKYYLIKSDKLYTRSLEKSDFDGVVVDTDDVVDERRVVKSSSHVDGDITRSNRCSMLC
jgi:hypothetical protein